MNDVFGLDNQVLHKRESSSMSFNIQVIVMCDVINHDDLQFIGVHNPDNDPRQHKTQGKH